MPQRYQRKHTRGYHLPPGTVCVTRRSQTDPGPWGPPLCGGHRWHGRRMCREVPTDI
jgi:hypothetical protein